jgi:predicted phosphodiesterase
VVNKIKKRNIPTIAGNYDFGIARMSNECGCAYKTDHDKKNGNISISFTNEIMKNEERKYLRTLPAHIKVEFQLNEDKLNLLLVHGSPRKINEYLFEDREEKSLLRIMEQADADIMCFGHTHKPYHLILNSGTEGQNHFRHAINIGSVGKPKDGNPQGCYVILTINDNSSIINKDTIGVDFIRFNYDVERAAKAIEESPLPDEYADMLRMAF